MTKGYKSQSKWQLDKWKETERNQSMDIVLFWFYCGCNNLLKSFFFLNFKYILAFETSMTATIELDHLLMSHQHLSTPLSLGRPAKRRRCPDHHPHSDRADPNRAQEFAQNFWKKLSPSAGPSRQSIQLGSIQSATSRLLLLIRGCRAAVVRQHAIVSRIGPVLRPHPIPYHPIPKTHSRPCCRQLSCGVWFCVVTGKRSGFSWQPTRAPSQIGVVERLCTFIQRIRCTLGNRIREEGTGGRRRDGRNP